MDYKILVGEVEYRKSGVRSVSIESPLFEKFSAGNACAAVLEMSFRPTATVPRMARIVPAVWDEAAAEWKQLGVFWLDERSVSSSGVMHIVAYDAMCKADVEWKPIQSLEFPLPMSAAVTEITRLMDVELDSRTTLNNSYQIDYPANGYTLRDVLCFIAAAHGGNWIITAAGKLLLVPLFGGMPEETNYLVDRDGNALTIGGVRILV